MSWSSSETSRLISFPFRHLLQASPKRVKLGIGRNSKSCTQEGSSNGVNGRPGYVGYRGNPAGWERDQVTNEAGLQKTLQHHSDTHWNETKTSPFPEDIASTYSESFDGWKDKLLIEECLEGFSALKGRTAYDKH